MAMATFGQPVSLAVNPDHVASVRVERYAREGNVSVIEMSNGTRHTVLGTPADVLRVIQEAQT